MNKKIKIAISGAKGKMGKEIIKEAKKKKIKICFKIIKKKNSSFPYNKKSKFISYSQFQKGKKNFDVLIDFTTPKSTLKYLDICCKNKKPIIIGTTGFNKQEFLKIKQASKIIPIVFSSNFSKGINLLLEMIKLATKKIGQESDIEILEIHHRKKKDSPSGTALTIGKKIAKCMNWDFKKSSIYRKKGNIGEREKNKIGFSIIRAGSQIGTHTIIFSDSGETIEITHKANNRNAFAKGVIKSILWVQSKKPGLFHTKDVFKNS